jgi:predicted site-specific integrase-resolvase
MALMYTSKEVSEKTGVNPSTLRVWLFRGKIKPALKIGRTLLWPAPMVAEVRRLVEKGVNRAS